MIAAITVAPLLVHDELRGHLDAGFRRARLRGAPVLVSVSVPLPSLDPLVIFVRAGALAHDRLYWERPADGVAVAGIGVAHAIEAAGAAEAGYAWRALLESALIDDVHGGEMDGPLLMGGFAFAPPQAPDDERTRDTPWEGFPPGRLTLPRLLLATAGGASVLTVNSVLWATTDVEAETARLLRWCECISRPATVVAWQTGGTAVPRMPPDRSRRMLPSPQAGSPRSRGHGCDSGPGPIEDMRPRQGWEARGGRTPHAC